MESKQKSFMITLYTRPGCSLCDVAKEKIRRAGQDFPLELECVDISQHPELEEEYGTVIPVIFIDGDKVFVSKMTELWLRRELEIRTQERA